MSVFVCPRGSERERDTERSERQRLGSLLCDTVTVGASTRSLKAAGDDIEREREREREGDV